MLPTEVPFAFKFKLYNFKFKIQLMGRAANSCASDKEPEFVISKFSFFSSHLNSSNRDALSNDK